MFLIDSHCHLDKLNYKRLNQNLSDIMHQAKKNHIMFVLTVCTQLSDFQNIKLLIHSRKDIAIACGVHPLNLDCTSYNIDTLQHIANYKNVIGIGETGLDYYYQTNNKKKQQEIFQEHIYISYQVHKPLIIHTRNACEDTINILYENKSYLCGGMMHCYTENKKTAQLLLDLGFYISFSGIVTFRNMNHLYEIIRYIPSDRLLIETDSPYLSPVPFRGKENQPAYLLETAKYISRVRGITLMELANVTTNNFMCLFHLSI